MFDPLKRMITKPSPCLFLVLGLLTAVFGKVCIAQEPAVVAETAAGNQAEAKADPSDEVKPQTDSAGEPPAETQTLLVNDKLLRFTLPVTWQQVEPRSRLVEVEFAILANESETEGDQRDPMPTKPVGTEDSAKTKKGPAGRLTMMAAGGDVDSNIRRWVGQFRLGRDADGKDAMRRDRRRLRGAVAHVLDIAGTFFDSPKGPLGPKVELPDYRMLGAIIEIEGAGKYFVKFYGPVEIVDDNAEAFESMLEQLEVVSADSLPVTEASETEPSTEATPSTEAGTKAEVQG